MAEGQEDPKKEGDFVKKGAMLLVWVFFQLWRRKFKYYNF